MGLIDFILVGIGLSIAVTRGSILLPVPNCSQVKPNDAAPWVWFNTKSPIDEELFEKKSSVRRKSSKSRTFVLRCWANYPISLTLSSIIINKEHIDQVKINEIAEYFEESGLFVVTSYIVIKPKEEFHLQGSCMPTCNFQNFPSGIQLLTTKEPNNLSKLQIHKAPSSTTEPNNGDGVKWMMVFLYFGVISVWMFALECLIYLIKRFACQQRAVIQVGTELLNVLE